VVHPGTGRVCVPINPKRLNDFDPLEVPTVTELLAEIDDWKAPEGETDGKSVHDWEKTRLKPYIEHFRTFVNTLMKDEKGVKVKREREENGADAMEF
jgi:DNA primase small subunit